MYDVHSLQLIAQGGQADIYKLGEDKVLRVVRDPARENL